MSHLYIDTLARTIDKVRSLIGDTDDREWQLTDEEIQFSIDCTGTNVFACAAMCAESIASRYARQVSRSNQGAASSLAQRQDHYAAMADRLRARSLTSGTIDIDLSLDGAAERPLPFRVGMWDYTRNAD